MRNTKEDRLKNPQDYILHPTKGYRRLRSYVREYIREGEALYQAFLNSVNKDKTNVE